MIAQPGKEPIQTDLGKTFDELAESAAKRAATTPSAPKPSQPNRLELAKEPRPTFLQEVRRLISEVPAEVRFAIRNCLTGETQWPLLIHGPAGTGKTCAALCLLDYTDGQYFTVTDLCDKLNQSAMGRLEWSKEGHGGTIWPDKFRSLYVSKPPLFVLDELGLRDSVSDAHYEAVYRCVEIRGRRPFVAISNHGLDRLEKIYDARTVSRLGSGTIVQVAGADRRLM